MNIVFLHIPKTAGQSVHHYLVTNFDEKVIFPARVNSQILNYTIGEIKKYKIFSGHFDLSFLDIVDQPKFTFTILRNPKDRILSYYFYIRNEAKKLTKQELNSPERQGMKAALELSPDEYFCDENLNIRQFIDNHYDNFYMYYFAMRSYQGKSFAEQLIKLNILDINNVYEKAIDSLKQLSAVYDIRNWNDLTDDLKKILPNKNLIDLEDNIHINKGDGKNNDERIKELMLLGATEKTLNRIDEFCKYDNFIYEKFCGKKGSNTSPRT